MKTLKCAILCFCFSAFQQVIGQNAFPKAYEIMTDTINTVTLPDSNWQFVEDRTATWTIDSVRDLSNANKFQYRSIETNNNDNPMKTYWVRYRLRNGMDREAKIALKFFGAKQCDMYLFETDGKETHLQNGAYMPWSKRNGTKSENILGDVFMPISILPRKELIIYIKNSAYRIGSPPSKLLIRFYSNEKMYADLNREAEVNYFTVMLNTFIFGISLLAFIFNFLFYLIIKDRIYLHFSLYVFFLGFGRFGEALFHLFFRENPALIFIIFPFCSVFIPFFFTYFLRSLLKISLKYPILDKILLTLTYAMLSIWFIRDEIIPNFFPKLYNLTLANIANTSGVFVWLFLLSILFLFIRTPEKSVRKIILALLPPFGIWVIVYSLRMVSQTLNSQFKIPFPFFYESLVANWPTIEMVCLLWIIVYFSWFLLNKFSELKRQMVQKELDTEIERSQLIEAQNNKLEEQVAQRTDELKKSLENLKSTQNQLIQKEKLASLGELTAGIAHEIQNPLNFVNNFSELSVDLVRDLKEEFKNPEKDEVYIDELFDDLSQNQEKINHHGKRASSIVKGMLEHSRTSTGERALTDINALADEYLRLSYHGMRAKDKSFNADYKTDFETPLSKISIVPQDMGRVLLNLYNNAFYAVHERKQQLSKSSQLLESYTSSVIVTTKQVDNQIIIKVKDNGTGMSESVKAKVFQPFFTTKPTGEGTGLGLSLAYDIVTKGHGGTLEGISTEGVGSEFIIHLPLK